MIPALRITPIRLAITASIVVGGSAALLLRAKITSLANELFNYIACHLKALDKKPSELHKWTPKQQMLILKQAQAYFFYSPYYSNLDVRGCLT